MRRLLLLLLAIAALPAARAEDVVLTFLHTNDMHGRVLSSKDLDADGPGGLARAAALARRIRGEMPHVLFFDAGDITHGTPVEYRTLGESEMQAMNAAGYDAATLGNHEFDWGQDATIANIGRARFPFVSANVRDAATGAPFGGARESLVFQEGPVKVGVFGLTTLETTRIEWPPAISRVRFEDPIAAARRVVPELRKQADIVVCLSHLGVKEDPELAAKVPGIDLILGGHSHTRLEAPLRAGGTLITQTGSLAAALGRVDMLLRKDGAVWKVASVNGEGGRWWADGDQPPLGRRYPKAVLLPLPESAPRDRAVVRAYQPFWDDAAAWLKTPLGEATDTIVGPGAAAESPLARLLGDLLREQVRADVALFPGDARPGIPQGPVTVRTVFENIGGYTRQNEVMVRATGAALRRAVEGAYTRPGSYPVYFAGAGGRVVRDGKTLRWEDATVGGRPLEDAAEYTVAGASYLIMDAPSLMASPLVSDTLGQQKTLLADAIAARKTLSPVPVALTLPPPPAPPRPAPPAGKP